MARIKKNGLVNGVSGNFNEQFVYRKRGKKLFLAAMPEINENLQPTEKQAEVRDMFGEAALYAQAAMANPEYKKQYQKKAKSGRTANNVAFRDYLKAPEVKSIKTDNYDGTPGSTIVVKAKDDFRVMEVVISIRTVAGVLVEQGKAILDPLKLTNWLYTATQNNADLANTVVKAIARDLPGNEGVLEIPL